MAEDWGRPGRQELTDTFGVGQAWRGNAGAATLWPLTGFDLLWIDGAPGAAALRRRWIERKQARPAQPLILLAAAAAPNLHIVGPREAQPIRELSAARVLPLLQSCRDDHPLAASVFLGRELARLEECVVPGLRVKDLLTPHFIRERLRWSEYRQPLREAIAALADAGAALPWRALFQNLGYRIEELPRQGYLLRGPDAAPLAVVHPFNDAARFSQLNANGELPEGLALADCRRYGAPWALLAAGSRLRIFQDRPPAGAATGHYLELDTAELLPPDRFYLGLLAPAALQSDGLLARGIAQSQDFGEELRRGLEQRLIAQTLPNLAQGLGEYLERQGVDLNDRQQLRRIEEAALTLVFRFFFLLHTEARGYLPVDTAAYRPYSARHLADTCRALPARLNRESTRRWDSLRTLVGMVRNGDATAGVPAYNGSLFAAAGFPGSELLEQAAIADPYLAPALAAIAYESDEPDAPGLDYAGLQVGHLGAIYEALLSLRLARAREDLVYDAKSDRFRPGRAGETPAVTRAQLYYQTQAGGRKAGGVYYTRQEFVRHLLNHSLLPALETHLQEVAALAGRQPAAALDRLFDFSIVDPAMGSAHFLTAALDLMADRIARFLAEVGGLPGIAEQFQLLTETAEPPVRPPEAADLLRRLILKRCIYGVDVSPMAVEVANVTLWLSSFVPGLALSWLGSNLKCGDALIGIAAPEIVGRDDSPAFTGLPVTAAMQRSAQLQRALAAIPDRTPAEVKDSAALSAQLQQETAGLRAAFNLWTAEPLGLDRGRHHLETAAAAIVDPALNPAPEVQAAISQAGEIADRYRFFHWPLEFPHIFHRERPGFDVVVGNPPWNKVKFEMPNFLALHDPGIHGLKSGLERDARAERLFREDPRLRDEVDIIQETVKEQRNFFRRENGYTQRSGGDTDLYKLFCERYSTIAAAAGYIGVVLPRAAFLNDGSREFRRWLFKSCRPVRFDALVNNGRWAFPVHPQYTIGLLIAQVGVPSTGYLAVTGPARNELEFADNTAASGVQISLADLAVWTLPPAEEPTWELPLLSTANHVEILRKLRRGVRLDRLQNPENKIFRKGGAVLPSLSLYTELHSAKQRPLFTHPYKQGRIAVLKGSSIGQYIPETGEVSGYGDQDELKRFLESKYARNPILMNSYLEGRIAFRRITRSTDTRTAIAAWVAPGQPLTDALACIAFDSSDTAAGQWGVLGKAAVLGIINSLPFDWLARRYVETTFNHFLMYGMTFPEWENADWRRIGALAARLSCGDDRFAAFAAAAGVECGPLTDGERAARRAEIDALVAAAYGLTAADLAFIFADFTENAVSPAYRAAVLERFANLPSPGGGL